MANLASTNLYKFEKIFSAEICSYFHGFGTLYTGVPLTDGSRELTRILRAKLYNSFGLFYWKR